MSEHNHTNETAEGNGTDLFDPYARFKFQLGQLVEHKVTGQRGMVLARILVQTQHGNTGRLYNLSWGSDDCTEIELEAVEGDDG